VAHKGAAVSGDTKMHQHTSNSGGDSVSSSQVNSACPLLRCVLHAVLQPGFYATAMEQQTISATRVCPQRFFCPGGPATAAWDASNPNSEQSGIKECPAGQWTKEPGATTVEQCCEWTKGPAAHLSTGSLAATGTTWLSSSETDHQACFCAELCTSLSPQSCCTC
jgi:hypothetical protein